MATALRRRIAPAIQVTLELQDEGGSPYKASFQVSYDFNAAAAIQEHTVSKAHPEGLKLTDASVWSHASEPIFFSVMFWAGIIARHPEYNSDEGLEVIRSYMDERNSDLIIGACWDAYLLGLTPEKRKFMEKLKDDAEKKLRGETVDPTSPAAKEATPEKNSAGLNCQPSPDTTSDLASKSSAA